MSFRVLLPRGPRRAPSIKKAIPGSSREVLRKSEAEHPISCLPRAGRYRHPQFHGANFQYLLAIGYSAFTRVGYSFRDLPSPILSCRRAHTAALTSRSLADGRAPVAALLPHDAARGEQQALSSLLQQIESNGGVETKLSLKIFHLQQLSMIRGSRYLLLQQHPGIAKLISDLTAATASAALREGIAQSELSPPQLHALALCCCKLGLPGAHPLWKGVAKQMVRHTKVSLGVMGQSRVTASHCTYQKTCCTSLVLLVFFNAGPASSSSVAAVVVAVCLSREVLVSQRPAAACGALLPLRPL